MSNSARAKKPAPKPAVEIPVYDPNVPEPSTRDELLKYWVNLTMNEKTAQKMLWVSEGGTKVVRLTEEVCPYLDRPERFELTPQVLCNEGFWNTRGYWEMKCSGWVVIGATYEKVGRKAYDGPCGLGENDESWGVGWAGSCYHAWHKGHVVEVVDTPYSSTLGVYVDQPAGIIKFYLVEWKVEGEEDTGRKEAKLIYKYQSPMTERVVPGIWVGRSSSCSILKKE
ncbi:tripartite motif-containing protein 16-like [Conger conger]|uniref:tripartite motif-containing protein 16-like n=1 Tax=Conger conger TaxID=82655 RepID=UPI002A5A0616|nr:tripartite motif-containing protein 16-like [Conger conger]